MKKLAILLVSIFIISCSKKDIRNVEKGTSSQDIENEFGKPQNKLNIYGYDYWRYNDYVVIIVDGKAEKVITQKHLDSAKVELEKSLKANSKLMDSLNKKTERELEEINKDAEITQEKLNKK